MLQKHHSGENVHQSPGLSSLQVEYRLVQLAAWPFSRDCIVYFSRSLSWFSFGNTHPAYTKPDLGTKHIPRHSCPFAARHVCGLGAFPRERLSVNSLTKASAFCIFSLHDLHPCIYKCTERRFVRVPSSSQAVLVGVQAAKCKARKVPFCLMVLAVLFNSCFLLLPRCVTIVWLKVILIWVVRLQQHQVYFITFYVLCI